MRASRATRISEEGQNWSLDDLPNELLITIIQEAAVTAWPGSPLLPQRLLPFTLINHRWANLILQIPFFWTTISLRRNTEDLEATTALQLELSRGFPLELIYHIDSGLIQRVAHLIRPHLHRVTCLHLLRDTRDNAGTDPFFPHTDFTSLRQFKASWVPSNRIIDFLSHHEAFAPYAHLLAVDPIPSVNLTFRDNHLVSIYLPVSSMMTIRRAEDITTLKEVYIYRVNRSLEDRATVIEDQKTPLSWEELQLRDLPWPVMDGLLSRCVYLVSLSLSIGQSDVPALLKAIPRLGALQRIFLRVLHGASSKPGSRSGKDNYEETKIREVDLNLDPYPTSVGVMIDLLYPLLRMSPQLESFKLVGYRGKALDFTEIDKLSRLRRLKLYGCRYIGEQNRTRAKHILALPSLELVETTGSGDVLNSLGSSTASRLVYTLPLYVTRPAQDTIQVCEQDWPALRTLSLGNASTKVKLSISGMALRRL